MSKLSDLQVALLVVFFTVIASFLISGYEAHLRAKKYKRLYEEQKKRNDELGKRSNSHFFDIIANKIQEDKNKP